jgi:hypothetical protein
MRLILLNTSNGTFHLHHAQVRYQLQLKAGSEGFLVEFSRSSGSTMVLRKAANRNVSKLEERISTR